MFKNILFSFFIISQLLAQTVDIQSYKINIELTNILSKNVNANTSINFQALQSLDTLKLDLLRMPIDSVKYQGNSVNFVYDSLNLGIIFTPPLNIGNHEVTVFYHGNPKQDPAGFGGFYFQDSTYAFNIGVSLTEPVHNYGKTWFPCVDNFTDKAIFEVIATVDTGKFAVCGGTLDTIINNGNGTLTFDWKLRDPIPTYLASIAISNYVTKVDSVQLMNGTLPLTIYVNPQDTNKLASFANLKNGLKEFEKLFGPYNWERVGYVSVPFNGGAMEHATNIAYPRITINGNLYYETLWAHELSHHWFGDLVTCETAEDMWLNEGFARYCESVFLEKQYNKKVSKDFLRDLTNKVLLKGHITDVGYFPVSGIPSNITYGTTVYDKGALVAHNLRNLMGDTLFFNSLKDYLQSNKYGNANSQQFINHLENFSGMNLLNFLNEYILTQGFSHFSIDSTQLTYRGGTNFEAKTFFKQQAKGRALLTSGNKITIGYMDSTWKVTYKEFIFSGPRDSFTVLLPFRPVVIMLDPEEYFADASIKEYTTIKNPINNYNFKTQYLSLNNVVDFKDSVFVRSVLHLVKPTNNQEYQGIYVGNRYHEILGFSDSSFNARGKFDYNATGAGIAAFLDQDWLNVNEDSLVLLYRKDLSQPWSPVNATNATGSNHTDGKGSFSYDSLKFGQYTIGYFNRVVSIDSEIKASNLKIYPNPSQYNITIESSKNEFGILYLFDSKGVMVKEVKFNKPVFKHIMDVSGLTNGTYFIKMDNPNSKEYAAKILISK